MTGRMSRRTTLKILAAAPLYTTKVYSGTRSHKENKHLMSGNTFFTQARPPLDIVDCQYHMGRGETEATLRAMDALGIRSLLIDEFWGDFGGAHPTHIQPGYRLPNGAWRAAWPTAELASLMHPDRFSYLVRIDRTDPELESLMRVLGSSPHVRAFRVQPAWTLDEVAALHAGAYDRLLAVAEELGRPVCFFVPGYVELLAPYAARFPRLTMIIDHCGMGFPSIPAGRDEAEARATMHPDYLEVICRMAEYPNVALKWSHAQNLFGAQVYPYESLRPFLRKVLDAFGKERIMWASDNSVVPNHTWGETLHYLRDDPKLHEEEKAWLLGRAARQILNWDVSTVS